jgi:hypothetical protein
MLHISSLHAMICLILLRREACTEWGEGEGLSECRVAKNAWAQCVRCPTDSSFTDLVMNHFDRSVISTFSRSGCELV